MLEFKCQWLGDNENCNSCTHPMNCEPDTADKEDHHKVYACTEQHCNPSNFPTEFVNTHQGTDVSKNKKASTSDAKSYDMYDPIIRHRSGSSSW